MQGLGVEKNETCDVRLHFLRTCTSAQSTGLGYTLIAHSVKKRFVFEHFPTGSTGTRHFLPRRGNMSPTGSLRGQGGGIVL